MIFSVLMIDLAAMPVGKLFSFLPVLSWFKIFQTVPDSLNGGTYRGLEPRAHFQRGLSWASQVWSLFSASCNPACQMMIWALGWGGMRSVLFVTCADHTSGEQRCLVSVCFPPAENTAWGHFHCYPFEESSPFHIANCCQLEFKAKPCCAVESFGCLTGDIVSEDS